MKWSGAPLGVLVCAVACTEAFGSFVSIRDAEGGESPLGSPGGYYLEGTGSSARAMLGGSSQHLAVGVFDFELSYNDGVWTEFLTFCTQPTVDIGFEEWPGDEDGFIYEAVPLTSGSFSDAEAVILEKLWFNAFDTALTGRVEAGAFQAIIWELTEDDTIDLSSGDFALVEALPHTQAIADLAREWLGYIDDGTWSGRESLEELTTPFSQNLLVPTRFVPTPGTAAVLGLGAVAWCRRRR